MFNRPHPIHSIRLTIYILLDTLDLPCSFIDDSVGRNLPVRKVTMNLGTILNAAVSYMGATRYLWKPLDHRCQKQG